MKKNYIKLFIGKPALLIAFALISFATQAQSYIQSTCDFAPMSTEGTLLCLGDDEVSAAIPLGFTFELYEVPFTDCYISSNGYLSFTAGLGSGCCTGVVLPSGTYPYSVFFGQEDLDPNSCTDGDITYYTTGAPGSQIFVLSYTDVPHYPGPEGTFPVTVQVQLYEGTQEVRIVTTSYNGDGGLSTMGLNQNATEADPVAGRNSEDWSAFDECISFLPDGLPDEGCTDPAAINYDPGAEIEDGSCFFGYIYSECDYVTMPSEGTAVCLGDDAVSAAIPMGFDFPFYGVTHSDIYIGSNGYVSFNAGLGTACCTGQVLPSGLYPNSIFLGQEDLDPNTCVDGDITYYTSGLAGSQIFVVTYSNVPHYPGPEGTFPVTMQLQLYEATGQIKIVVTEWNSDGGAATMGLNWDGAVANPVAGRNSEVWDAFEECHSWMPSEGPIPVCDIPTGLYVDGISTDDAILHWDAMEGADQYRVTLQNTVTGLIKTRGYESNVVEIIDKLTPLTTYAFRVKTVCYDILGEITAPSEWYYFTTLGRIGTTEAAITMYPNPNAGQFTLQISDYSDNAFELYVFDAMGKIVYNKSIQIDNANYSEQINLENVASGIYQVKLLNNDAQITYPVVIQK